MRRIFSLCLLALLFSGLAQARSNPAPFLDQPLVPATKPPGGPAFNLTLHGTGFVPKSVVNWNKSRRITHFVSRTELQAKISAADIATAGSALVTVANPSPGGGISNTVSFQIDNQGALSFRTATFGTGSFAFALASGDINHDGNLDFVLANAASAGTLVVMLGNGDGTFQNQTEYAAGNTSTALAVGDFNRDGNLDVAVDNYGGPNGGPGSVSLFLGNGDGSFQPALTVDAGQGPFSIVAGDFNGDGKLDVAVAEYNNSFGSEVGILLGNGDGTFQPMVAYATGQGPARVLTGDFNGDGKLDLATSNRSSNDVSILLGNGDGTFQSHVDHPVVFDAFDIAAADLNGDNTLDLAVLNGTGNPFVVSVLLGNGDGTFQPRVDYTIGEAPKAVGIADINGDNQQDLVMLNGNHLEVLLGAGNATFRRGARLTAPNGAQSVTIGDFNRDGKPDVAMAVYLVGNQQVAVMEQTNTSFERHRVPADSVRIRANPWQADFTAPQS